MKAELEALVEQMISRGIFFDEAVKEFEKKFILNTLTRYNNNLSKAAAALGIHRNTLSKRVYEYQNGAKASANGHANGNGTRANGSRAHGTARKTVKKVSRRG